MKKADKFKKYVAKWQIKLGMLDWEIYVDSDKSDKNRGWINADTVGRIAVIFYNEKWIQKASEKEIERVAFHEVVEILLYPITENLNVFYSDDYCVELTHKVIRTLESAILGYWQG